MRWCARWGLAALLCGCPGDPVEGQASIGSNGESTTSDASMTMSDSSPSTMTMGSQSGTDSTSGALTMTTDDTDPTLEDTSADATIGETTIAATDDTSTASAGTSESTGEAVCVEVNKPNDTEATAVPLAAIACETSMNVEATADDATAPDWFTFHGAYADACGGDPEDYGEPRVQVAGLPVCAFASCRQLGVTCLVGDATVSPGGLSGCCGNGDAHLLVDCESSDESADVFVMVDTAGADCQPYTMTLSF